MFRPNGWIFGLILLAIVAGFAFIPSEPPARDAEAMDRAVLPHNPNLPLNLEGCVSIAARQEYERTDCLQSVRLDLIAGEIDWRQALRRLEACADFRGDLADLGARRAAIRVDSYRARLAFGETLEPTESIEYEELVAASGRALETPPNEDVALLRRAGITPEGIPDENGDLVLARLQEDETLRAAFRSVFGELLADDLEAIVDRDASASPPALILGNSVIVPNLPVSTSDIVNEGQASLASPGVPLIVPTDAFAARLTSELRGLELARMRFFASAAEDNRRVGSIAGFVSRLFDPNGAALEAEEIKARVEVDRTSMLNRYRAFESRLGADPLLVRMVGESVGLAVELDDSCQVAASSRGRRVRAGAGILTGLIGAAGFVVATGATGTMAGGVTIAAAVEATIGAVLMARSERVRAPAFAMEERRRVAPVEVEERRFDPVASESDLLSGREGQGGGVFEQWFDDEGEALEHGDFAGLVIEEEDGEATESGLRADGITPDLPTELPSEQRELPPLLASAELMELRDLSLPEIQERLDQFLALGDPTSWALLAESEDILHPVPLEEMIAEATESLYRWETRRELSEQFGSFFIRAEVQRLPASQQADVLLAAMGRYIQDRELLRDSRDVEDLRRRLAGRLVAHCRASGAMGDLVLTACTEETALSILTIAALQDAGIVAPAGSILGVQAFGDRFEAVLFDRSQNYVYSLTRGEPTEGVVAPIYHPATFYYGYLLSHGVVPDIDVDAHLMIALPDRPMPIQEEIEECRESTNVVGRAVEWIGSLMGVRRLDSPCGGGRSDQAGSSEKRGGIGVDLAIPMPRNPLQGGGGQSGGMTGGGGGGTTATDPLAGAGPRDPTGGGESARSGGQPGGSGSEGKGSGPGDPEATGDGTGSGGAGQGEGTPDGTVADEASMGGLASQGTSDATAGAGAGESGSAGSAESMGTGGSGGYGVGDRSARSSPNLTAIGRETVELTAQFDQSADLRVMPWRLREDAGMITGSSTRVLYADNARALERFEEDDLFLTLTPAEVEAQRRMLEADEHPIYQAETDCDALGLPPRGVFRRAAAGEQGFRYVFCSEKESMVIFRQRSDAENYAALSAPDRPLYLTRLATQRLESFERSIEVERLRAFLDDPNTLRDYSRDEIVAMSKAAGDLLVFQNALESALVQSMNELGPSQIRGYYYDMHRQVLQAPLFLSLAESVHRLNRRLASDPLKSLAWANVQPRVARQGFFDLYHTLGGMMAWPERWAVLQQRYGSEPVTPPADDPNAPSLDFLQVLSDPTRVQVDWSEERVGAPSIHDRSAQEGMARTEEEKPIPTLAEDPGLQDETEHQRGGTGGLGRSGEGASAGPERGQKPLRMIHIRISPEEGEPDRQQLPDDNQVRPGGTEGSERRQTEESATRQEPVLWLSPETFIDAILSPWDYGDLDPRSASRVPPVLRFHEKLREVFLRELHPDGLYDNRLRAAMKVFTAGNWLRYTEVRGAMDGSWSRVRAYDTGRFSAAYSGNPPINDQDQIQIPNFFQADGVVIPADLFDPVRSHYTSSILGIFDLAAESTVPPPIALSSLPIPPGDSGQEAREQLLRSLELIRAQAAEW